jgi:tellurite resistance protein
VTDTATATAQAGPRNARRPRRVPPNFFAIPFGIAGLGEAWEAARPVLGLPRAVPDVFLAAAALLWLLLVVAYLAQGLPRILADLRDPVLSPFTSLAVITPMIPGAALAEANLTAGRIVVIVFATATIALGGFLTGQWIVGDLDQGVAHPGYFLPTVAGGLVASYAAAEVQLHSLAEGLFGIGVLCWLLLGSLVLNRLFFTRMLPPPLVPTLAIELAPPAVAGLAWFALNGGTIDLPARVLGGYAVLMALVQLRFLPVYRRLHFSPGFWAFTFSYTAAAGDALCWIRFTALPGRTALSIAALVLVTGLVGVIAIRTARLALRGQLLPAAPPAPVSPTAPASAAPVAASPATTAPAPDSHAAN